MEEHTLVLKNETLALRDETLVLKNETLALRDETLALKNETAPPSQRGEHTLALRDETAHPSQRGERSDYRKKNMAKAREAKLQNSKKQVKSKRLQIDYLESDSSENEDFSKKPIETITKSIEPIVPSRNTSEKPIEKTSIEFNKLIEEMNNKIDFLFIFVTSVQIVDIEESYETSFAFIREISD